ncbi:protein of unknown function [Candidatus Nitrospira inopinata]|uniref:Uncharacterized protein n=1 Tax=Candidatus Nitrospira inopinata TaxID=1715989 RepID=A0A0S4KSS9_9BACT|nr:protein of unknown function [Candidatus Nitrospira inopinata]
MCDASGGREKVIHQLIGLSSLLMSL